MRYHLIGIEGISMSSLAKLLENAGHQVSGSDIKTSGHSAENIDASLDRVVRTSAVTPGSPGWVEVERANELNIPVLKRSELLGELTDQFELIAVSGMHGKTTVTSMVGLVLLEAGFDPTVLVGEHIAEFDGSALHIGKSKYFVLEACEYDRSFLDFSPNVLILTNLDREHLDTFPGGLPEIKDAFSKYLNNVREGGIVIANSDDENLYEVVSNHEGDYRTLWYGKKSPNYNKLDTTLSIPGKHNRSNALAVAALADYYQIEKKITEKVFRNFKGAKRRLEYWGELNNSLLYDDYGHHPTEIAATVSALKEKYPDRKLVVIFWPHQYKRILPLMQEFAGSFAGCDKVYIKKIFFVPGRDEKLDVSSEQLAKLVRERGGEAESFNEDDEIMNTIKDEAENPSVIVTMGIPPIYKLWEKILGE